MRALEQFWKFYTSFANGIGPARRLTEHEGDERYAHSPDDQRTENHKPAARDDEKLVRHGSSYPAVWPR